VLPLGLEAILRLDQLFDELSDPEVSLLLTGDRWELRDGCVCWSSDRFALQLRGVADVHGP
jgi:hypothetical protein